MKVLIIYGTTEGQTRKICEFLRNEAIKLDHEVVLADATQNPPAPDKFDAVIIAGSVHMGKYQDSIQEYVRNHHEILNRIKSIFLSVSLAAAADEPESWKELRKETDDFLSLTGWKPDHVEYVAGALLYTKYDFFKRFIMRLISKRSGGETDTSKDHEYTDWTQVKDLLIRLVSAKSM